MESNFNPPTLLKDGDLSVTGPVKFLPEEKKKVLGPIAVRFLIIQPPATSGGTESIIISEGTWSTGANWTATVPSADVPAGFDLAKPARAIGLMVIVKQGDQPQPYFETVTWCVNLPTPSAPVPGPPVLPDAAACTQACKLTLFRAGQPQGEAREGCPALTTCQVLRV